MTITTTMTAYNERFTFSGKEKDSETGYYYFGARYYNPDFSLWLSVDPMADKYPGLSPYNYCAWNPVRLIDPDGNDWYKKENDYYWSDRVISKNTTPKGCMYIGDDKSLYRHFGLPSSPEPHETKQAVQIVVGTNAESNNQYENKYYAFGTALAKAKSSIEYSIQKDEKTGKLKDLTINARLETIVNDIVSGGYAAAFLEVSYGDVSHGEPFKEDKRTAFVQRDICTRKYLNASITVSASDLSENCFSKLRIKGPWISNGKPMAVPFTLGVIPRRLKHKYK